MNLIVNTCNGKCSRCGQCCTIGIPITKKEELTIRKYIKEKNITPENLYEGNNFYAYCCFYDRKNHKCKIYDVRPSICRSFQCDRNCKKLEKEKFENHKRAFWNYMDSNGEISNFTTFDLLFYDNPKPLLDLISSQIDKPITKDKYISVIKKMKKMGLSELVECMEPCFEDD